MVHRTHEWLFLLTDLPNGRFAISRMNTSVTPAEVESVYPVETRVQAEANWQTVKEQFPPPVYVWSEFAGTDPTPIATSANIDDNGDDYFAVQYGDFNL